LGNGRHEERELTCCLTFFDAYAATGPLRPETLNAAHDLSDSERDRLPGKIRTLDYKYIAQLSSEVEIPYDGIASRSRKVCEHFIGETPTQPPRLAMHKPDWPLA